MHNYGKTAIISVMRLYSLKSIVLAFVFLAINDVFNDFANGGGLDKELLLSKALIRGSTLVTVWVFLSLTVGGSQPHPVRK